MGPEKNNTKSFISGGITGTITQFITFPLDYYKTRRQLISANNLSFYQNLIKGFRIAIPQSLSTFPRVGIRFYSFQKYDNYLNNKLIAGILAGLTETITIYNVTETIKTNAMKKGIKFGESRKYIYKNMGIAGFYNGMLWTILRQSTSQGFSFYFQNKYCNLLEKYDEKKYLNIGQINFISGTFAGMSAVIINNPIDVIKTRKQASKFSTLSIIKTTLNQGILTFYKGCFSRMIRLGIQQGLNFYLFSKVSKFYDKNIT